jgi:hypothetical protein
MPRARLRASGPLARLPLSLSNLGHPGISDKMGSISTRMTERFGCRHPFAGAGMAFAGSTADLALGVCAGGGIGAIGVGFTPAEQLRAVIHQIRAATGAPFNINFITCFDNDPQIRVCAEEKVPVASFHWGHPSPEHLRLLRDAGVSAWEQVGGVEAAKKAVGDGVEVIVAQGWEASGRGGASGAPFQPRFPHRHGVAGPQHGGTNEHGVADVLPRTDRAARTPNDAEDTSDDQDEPDPLSSGEGLAKHDSG